MNPPTQYDDSNNCIASTGDSQTEKKGRIELVHHREDSNIAKKVSPDAVARMKTMTPSELSSLVASLSGRELEVFNMLGRARTTRQIADELHLSIKTVQTNLSRIKVKLGVESFNELIVSAALWINSQND